MHAPIRSHTVPSKQILLLFYHIIMYNILLSWSFNINSYKPSEIYGPTYLNVIQHISSYQVEREPFFFLLSFNLINQEKEL